jgi:hypothetical protein
VWILLGLVSVRESQHNAVVADDRRRLIQPWQDRSDNLDKACAESLATKKAMQGRFPDYQRRYKARYP